MKQHIGRFELSVRLVVQLIIDTRGTELASQRQLAREEKSRVGID